jgi:hypothetical protein
LEDPVMVRRRIAVLGLSGVVLIAMVAGALRIHTLEQRVASLEKRFQAGAAPLTNPPVVNWVPAADQDVVVQYPDGAVITQSPDGMQPLSGQQLPQGTTSHQINGLTYYVMPLGDDLVATPRR